MRNNWVPNQEDFFPCFFTQVLYFVFNIFILLLFLLLLSLFFFQEKSHIGIIELVNLTVSTQMYHLLLTQTSNSELVFGKF